MLPSWKRKWIDTHRGDIFESIIAWMKWRKGKTISKWVRSYSGIKGNEEADKLAGKGAMKPLPNAIHISP